MKDTTRSRSRLPKDETVRDCASRAPCPRADERAQRPHSEGRAVGPRAAGAGVPGRPAHTPPGPSREVGPQPRRRGLRTPVLPGRPAAGEVRPPIPPGLRRFRPRRGLPGRRGRRAVGRHVEGTAGRDARGGGRLGEDGDGAPRPRAPGSLPPPPRPPRSSRAPSPWTHLPGGQAEVRRASGPRPGTSERPGDPLASARRGRDASDSALPRDACRAATLQTTACSESDVISGFTVYAECKANLPVTLIPVYCRTARPEGVGAAPTSVCAQRWFWPRLAVRCFQLLLWSRADFLLES